jgi:hypothetical protein
LNDDSVTLSPPSDGSVKSGAAPVIGDASPASCVVPRDSTTSTPATATKSAPATA